MVTYMETKEYSKLASLCYEIAKDLKWQRKPIDAKEIDSLSKELYHYAFSSKGVVEDYGYDIRIIEMAAAYISQTMDGPWLGNEAAAKSWFFTKLDTILELAVFTPDLSGDAKEFLNFLLSKKKVNH